MYAHDGRVYHLDGGIMSDSKRVHEPAPYASSPPADEAVIAGSIWAVTFRQITPWEASCAPSTSAASFSHAASGWLNPIW